METQGISKMINEELNDDDLYLIDKEKKKVVKNLGNVRVPFMSDPNEHPTVKAAKEKLGMHLHAAKGIRAKYMVSEQKSYADYIAQNNK